MVDRKEESVFDPCGFDHTEGVCIHEGLHQGEEQYYNAACALKSSSHTVGIHHLALHLFLLNQLSNQTYPNVSRQWNQAL